MADEFGISDKGFKRKRLSDILIDKNNAVRSVFGNGVNLSPQSPDGQLNGVYSESDSLIWELLEDAYNAFLVSDAGGILLSKLVQLNGITRKEATNSTADLTFSGTAGTIIPAGTVVADANDKDYVTSIEGTISGGSVIIQATESGGGEVVSIADTITDIKTSIFGLDSVTNVADATIGNLEETDEDLRVRRRESVAFGATAVVDAIFAGVANIDGVDKSRVYENDLDVADANGIPAHHIEVVTSGSGDDLEIATSIFDRKTAGTGTNGTTDTNVTDSQGIDHNISHQKAVLVPIYIDMDLTTNSSYPASGDDDIKQAIVDYFAGEFECDTDGIDIGDDVIHSRLITPINSVAGHFINTLFIDITPSPVSTSNIAISYNNLATIDKENINITKS